MQVARQGEQVRLSEAGIAQVKKSRAIVDRILEEERPVYGISTGFGDFSKVFIQKEDRAKLQRNLILSHPTRLGDPLTNRTPPIIPCKGSVGASGDLAPLAHMVLVMLGEGEAEVDGRRMSGAEALAARGLEPIVLSGKEGLALINGTQIMTAVGCMVWDRAVNLMKAADIAAALSLEALKGTRSAFDRRITEVRPYPGQMATTENVLALTEDSAIIASHKNCSKVQDAYSLRCVPQVHGASKEALAQATRRLTHDIKADPAHPRHSHAHG